MYISQVVDGLQGKSITVGAQNSAVEPAQGALTGEIAPSQLVDAGCGLVLIGHSERRQIIGENDEVLNRKFAAAQACGLKPVLCVGETLEEREAGKTLEIVGRQLGSIIEAFGVEAFTSAVIAYEPVWAIGTGLTASPQQAQDVHAAIRAQLAAENAEVAQNVQLLYGGSVKAANAAELFGMPDIDGGLIGGASLNADEFGAICRAAGN
ncbi:triosephosphate isomerase [Pseudomonas sp. JUb96]|nr:triosephosphate isomerase [Pseudomonas sp. JUb96]